MKHPFHKTLVALLAIGTLAFGLAACDDDDSAATGTARVSLVDAPSDLEGLESIDLVLSDVRIHRSSEADAEAGGWVDVMPDTLTAEQRSYNLLELTGGVSAVLGEAELTVGNYQQIRLIIESASITIDGESYPLTIPSGMQTGVKVVGGFQILADQLTELTLDFDAMRSVYEAPPGSDNWRMKPTVRLLVDMQATTGAVAGTVLPVGIGSNVVATVPATGDTMATTFADATTGAYELLGLSPGSYHVTANAAGYSALTDSNVAVAAGMNTSVDFTLTLLP